QPARPPRRADRPRRRPQGREGPPPHLRRGERLARVGVGRRLSGRRGGIAMPAYGKPTACQACHSDVLAVRVPYLDRPVLLDPEQLPITTDLEPLVPEALAWQYLGPRIGWEPLHVAARTWRPVH